MNPALEVEATHTFGTTNWIVGDTALSSGEGSRGGNTSVRVKLTFNIGNGQTIEIPADLPSSR